MSKTEGGRGGYWLRVVWKVASYSFLNTTRYDEDPGVLSVDAKEVKAGLSRPRFYCYFCKKP